MYRLLAYALVLLSLGLAQGVLMGRASVVDGDTLEIQGVRVRLWGIDAVESSQTCLDASGKPWPCGRRAAFALADFLLNFPPKFRRGKMILDEEASLHPQGPHALCGAGASGSFGVGAPKRTPGTRRSWPA
jgi:hypothetical protein